MKQSQELKLHGPHCHPEAKTLPLSHSTSNVRGTSWLVSSMNPCSGHKPPPTLTEPDGWLHRRHIQTTGWLHHILRVAMAHRLGCRACEPHKCACGKTVDARGFHGLACRRSVSRQQRHYHLNDTVLTTVTMIVWTHQLYSCHNTYGCRVLSQLELPKRSLFRVCSKHNSNSSVLLNALAGNKEYV